MLLHLEVGDAITHQAADAVILLEQRYKVAGTIQLLRGSHSCWTGSDHSHALSSAFQRRLRLDPAHLPRVVDDAALDYFNGDRRLIDPEHARGLTRRWTDAPGELRKVVGGVQHADGILPAVAVNQIVPVGNDVVQRTAGMTEGNAAVHAAGTLRAYFLLWEV